MKTIKIELNQESLSLFTTSFSLNNDVKIDNNKLTQSITKAVFKRYQAQLNGLRSGLKISKPFCFRVIVDNEEILNTDTIASSIGMCGKIKISVHTFKKDQNEAKELFQSTLLYIITSSSEFSEDIKQSFI